MPPPPPPPPLPSGGTLAGGARALHPCRSLRPAAGLQSAGPRLLPACPPLRHPRGKICLLISSPLPAPPPPEGVIHYHSPQHQNNGIECRRQGVTYYTPCPLPFPEGESYYSKSKRIFFFLFFRGRSQASLRGRGPAGRTRSHPALQISSSQFS